MKRLLAILSVVAVLAIGSTAVALALEPGQPGDPTGWWCPGWGWNGAQGSYDPNNNPVLKQLADKIGISVEDLVGELKAGKSVADVAKEKGVEEQALVDFLNAPMVEMMNLGVKYGRYTQEQADAMQKYMAEQIKYQLEQKGFPGGYGWGPRMMGSGMMGPRAGSFNGTPDPDARGFGGMFGGLMRGFGGMFGSGMRGFGGMMGSGMMGTGF